MTNHTSSTLGQMAVESPEVIPVFEKYALDYYQKGNRTLAQACQDAGLDAAKILEELEAQPPFPMNEMVDERSSLSEIVHHIVQRHHDYVRGQLGKMEDLLDSLGGNSGEASEVGILWKYFLRLDGSLRHHLLAEEIEVFPRLIWVERREGDHKAPPVDSAFLGAVQQVLLDHRMMDREFMELKKIVYHFRTLNPKSEALEDLYKALEGLDQDNHRHIHIENNVLLRKAVALGILRGS